LFPHRERERERYEAITIYYLSLSFCWSNNVILLQKVRVLSWSSKLKLSIFYMIHEFDSKLVN